MPIGHIDKDMVSSAATIMGRARTGRTGLVKGMAKHDDDDDDDKNGENAASIEELRGGFEGGKCIISSVKFRRR